MKGRAYWNSNAVYANMGSFGRCVMPAGGVCQSNNEQTLIQQY